MNEEKVETPVRDSFRKDSKRYFFPDKERLNNWVQERTLPAERKARASIVGEMVVDGILNQLLELGDYLRRVAPSIESGPVVIGNPSTNAIENIESILKEKGFETYGPAEVTIQSTDSVSGETVMTTIGRDEEEGCSIYFGEEKNASGEVISRAVINTGDGYAKTKESDYGFAYRLELHYKGGRYTENNAEVDLDSASSPRATAKTLELLSNVVKKRMNE